MGQADESDEDVVSVGHPSKKRMTLFIAVMTIIIAAIVIVSVQSFVDRSHRPTEAIEELGPWDYPFYRAEESAALEAANGQLARMEFGDISTINPDSSEYRARLFRHNNWGIVYWQFEDWNTEIWVDADTGEIIRYFNSADNQEGPSIAEENAEAYVMEVISQFAHPPADMDPPYVRHSSWTYEEILLPNGTWGGIERYDDWDFYFNRSYEGIQTSDGISVWLELDGTLIGYSKDWFMDLDDLDTTFTVSADEAESEARRFLADEHGEPNETLVSCERGIIYPTGMDWEMLPGETPQCVWRFEFTGPGLGCNTHWVGVTGKGEPEVVYFVHCR